jgi:hypothetical protein
VPSVSNLTFTQVTKVHRTMRGIYAENGVATSLLCNVGKGSKYPNRIEADRIEYIVGPTTLPNDVNGLREAMRLGTPVRVFTRRAKNAWQDLGGFVVEGLSDLADGGWRAFSLRRQA